LLDAGFLACVATRIVNEIKGIHQVNGINRVARDHMPKPPGTIAWELGVVETAVLRPIRPECVRGR
jgi:hypothetical protein